MVHISEGLMLGLEFLLLASINASPIGEIGHSNDLYSSEEDYTKSIPNGGKIKTDQFENDGVNIINGSFASIGEFPYTVLTIVNKYKHCGASLIGPKYVLSAAHCFNSAQIKRNASITTIRVNELDITKRNQTQTRDYVASKIIIHPNYNNTFITRNINDVCLIILHETVEYNLYVQPILLAQPGDGYFVGDEATQSGWGQTEKGYPSNELRKLNTRVVSQQYCIQKFYDKRRNNVSDVHICTYMKQRASCYGDSGSPLVAHRKRDGNRVQIGVVSWATPGCYAPGYPTVYARVSVFYDWIQETINKHENSTKEQS